MKRFILTGAPGSGKTAILRQLEFEGFSVVEEAATDVIALEQAQGITEPWTRPSFIESATKLQRLRQLNAAQLPGAMQFHDRSIFCTIALAQYLGHAAPDILHQELERIRRDEIFQKRVFFIQNLGFITPTEARRISFEETLRFERIHEETYRGFGFEIVLIPAGSVPERTAAIKSAAYGM